MQVGAAGDAFEREADRIAGDVVNRLAGGDAGPAATPIQGAAPVVRRDSGGGSGGFAAPDHVVAGIESARGGGQPLPGRHLRRMQAAFGADLSGVRIHTDSNADTLARSIDARAFTTGNDVFFRSGEFRPDNADGQHVLAHELTHTLQQSGGVQRTIQRFAINENPPKLSEATKIKKAGSGQTGAFLLWKGSDGLVTKFHADNPARVLLAEQIMDDNGVSTPNTRVFDGPTLYHELTMAWMNLSGTLSQPDQAVGWELLEQFGKEPWGLVMTMNKGKSFGDRIWDAKDANDDQAIVDLWSDPQMLITLGEIVAIDAFLGNADRFSMHTKSGKAGSEQYAFMNHGNWMTYLENERTRVATLDNDSMLGAFNEMTEGKTVDDIREWVGKNIRGANALSDTHARNLASIETLFDPQQFIDAIQRFIAQDGGFKWPKAMEQLSWNVTGRYLTYGIKNARERIMANLDRYLGMMSNLHAQHGSDGAFDKQAMQDRVDYLKMREGGATEEEAIESLEVGALGNTGILASLLADLLVFDPEWETVTPEPRKGGLLKRAKRKLGVGANDQAKQNLGALDDMFTKGTWMTDTDANTLEQVIELRKSDSDAYIAGQVITRAQIVRTLQFERPRGEALAAAADQLSRVTAQLGKDDRAGEIAAQTASAAQTIMAPKDPRKPLISDNVEPLFARFTANAQRATTNPYARAIVNQEFGSFNQGANAFKAEWTKLAQAQARRAMAARNGGGRRRRLVKA